MHGVWLFLTCFSLSVEAQLAPWAAALEAGHYSQAVAQAESALLDNRTPLDQAKLSLTLARAYRHLGLYSQALASLHAMVEPSRKPLQPQQEVALFTELSKVYLSQGRYADTDPRPRAKQALALARQLQSPNVLAQTLNHWGNLMSAEADLEAAQKAYQEGMALLAPEEPLLARLQINLARVQLRMDEENAYLHSSLASAYQDTLQQSQQALASLQSWPENYQKLSALLALATLALDLDALQQNASAMALAYQILNAALPLATQLQHPSEQSLANGLLGQLYLRYQRHEEAAQLTRQALFHAASNTKQPRRHRWWRQLGLIRNAEKNPVAAIRAYRHAIIELGPVRTQVATTGYYQNAASFRQQIAPYYFELADLLLGQAATKSEAAQRQPLLSEARAVIEAYKKTALRDYFKGECLQDQSCLPLDALLDEHTAILYPIVLKDRLSLLLTLPDGTVIQHSVVVSENTLRATSAFFLSALRAPPRPSKGEKTAKVLEECIPASKEITTSAAKLPSLPQTASFAKPAQKLYHWLIDPLRDALGNANIDTLVVVPEGILRTIPFAALYNGRRFLVEDYAIATAPSYCIAERRLEDWDKASILAVGLSEEVQGFPEIPCAGEEVQTIGALYGNNSQRLLNDAFVENNLASILRERAYPIIHIASHAQFSAALEDTFLLTYDGRLNLNDLERLLRLGNHQDMAVELLTLSACETAVGNDRAALGLAGVALKAGVTSTLASLWRVDDAATPAVIVEFYRQMKRTNTSKAKALQQAQQRLLLEARFAPYHHPYYWAPFLLLGNWL